VRTRNSRKFQIEALEERLVLSEVPKLVPPEFADRVPLLSGMPMLLAAESLGITQIAGKDISGGGSPPGNAQAKKLKDVPIAADPTEHENEPTVAANPTDKKILVSASHLFPTPSGVSIAAYRSTDSGATWSGPVIAPQLTSTSQASDPVLAYTPDGSRVYLAYMDIKPSGDWDIIVSRSDDDGATWSAPVIALDGNPAPTGFQYDKPWIAADNTHVYVTATQFEFAGPIHIALASSSDKGVTFPNSTAPVILETSRPGLGEVLEGSRPTVGPHGEMLVAWYSSGTDGWLNGSFEIHTARSANFGASFDPPVVAATDSYELPYWLGPNAFYHRWWGGMFPDVEIDAKGDAHIVYTHDPVDPVANPRTAEDGDIRYITSSGPSFTSWSSPVTVNDDASGKAQGYPALETQHGGGTLHVIWEDHRLSSTDNLYYDIFYSRKVPGNGVGWSTNFRVSDTSSISDLVFIGDYNDLTANDRLLFGVWTDRRDKISIFDLEDDVYGSRIIAGGAAPTS
jgi:hypothetical protein